ncbi:MAG: lysophospholipase [bacterium]|nr:MAG: lysophospholipase [bacterium]
MKKTEDYFTGVNETQLYYQVWRPEGTAKAGVQFLHGYATHSGWDQNVYNELTSRGYVIYAADHRGHGKSEGDRAYVKKFENYVEDQKIFFDLIKENEGNLPIFMVGHSMGATIAQIFAATYQDTIKGLVLSGLGYTIAATKGLLGAVARFLVLIVPKFKKSVDLADKISHDPDVVKLYREDPLNLKKGTARLGVEFMKGCKKTKKLVSEIKIPTLVQAGAEDEVLLDVELAEDLMTMPDKTIIIYDGLYHEVYNEVEEERKKVLQDLGDWLDNHLE